MIVDKLKKSTKKSKNMSRKTPLEIQGLDRNRPACSDEKNNKLEHKLGMEQSEEKPSAGMNSIGLNRTRQE
jgi:hypothetical protein